MNTSSVKAFAPTVRRQLIEAVTRKLDYVLTATTADLLTIHALQVAALRKLAQADRNGLIERVAYTWFNRFAALRFLDAQGWHPFHTRIITPTTPDDIQPEILRAALAGTLPAELEPFTDPKRVNSLLDGTTPSPDPQGEVYRHLVLAACRFYNALLPNLFEKLDDEIEFLLPEDLLTEHSVVHGFRTEISDDDCNEGQRANVEILGWLYQFYISERKDQVMARKSAVPTEDIPAVTQLFTPHWIVRYLVENSLGRLWLLNHPSSGLRAHMPYYIEGEPETDFLKIAKPEEIKLCDPACGSGHMLTYAFDLLYLIYEEEGYAPADIPGLILKHNLYGLEICPRAAQLTELALVFKAREKSRRFFQPYNLVQPHIIELQRVCFAEYEMSDYIHTLGLGDLFHQPVLRLLHQFEEAKNFGSLIQPCMDEAAIGDLRKAIKAKNLDNELFLREIHLKVMRVLDQAEALTQRYHVVVANPPYMGTKQMPPEVKVFAESNYPDSKSDLFAMFIERAFTLAVADGTAALVTMQSWMFLSSFQNLRVKLLNERTIITAAHMGNMVMGIAFGTVATVWSSRWNPEFGGQFSFVDLGDLNKDGVPDAFPVHNERLKKASACQFECIPAKPIAYWLSQAMLDAFKTSPPVEDVAKVRGGMTTGDNARFLRLWHEVSRNSFGSGFARRDLAAASDLKWFPYNKGGSFRRWYGNQDYVVNWKSDGQEILSTGRASPRSREYYFQEALTYTATSSSYFAVRYSPVGFLFDAKGSFCVPEQTDWQTLLGLLNSKLVTALLKALNPTIEFQAGDISRLPFKELADLGETHRVVIQELVQLARTDWDNFVTSWDFRDQPLLRPGLKGSTLDLSWQKWEAQCTAAIRRMQELETENNRLFIAAYGLEGELQPEVPEEQITLARADARKDMAALLSYAIGCMMGRYSLAKPGLILANAGDTLADYDRLTPNPSPLTPAFRPDEDGIIPVLDGEWFEDDIVARTRGFLRATYGEGTLRENLRFIEESLGKDIRRYFLNDFYKDHLQTYKRRPIYWLVQSPKKGFSVLIYLHRYTRDTLNIVLNRYLRPYLEKLRGRIAQMNQTQTDAATNARDKTAARKELDKLVKTLRECEEWERQTLLPLAQQRIELDLDDGVKVNYLKLGEALAPIPGLAAKEDE